ncbi:hypothetical protein [Bizionia myxarmorum]|uniref:Uncharacterized protein n=1 Tax=Bizionia myxarmorum TaxID=291186 RepID=A0A5D0R480_9FLAO|nr:hypothetical protein [Bizionia myxarmorum]TYB75785.1 hypothetical protein ES674_13240 [Bizionia myxarmorum]
MKNLMYKATFLLVFMIAFSSCREEDKTQKEELIEEMQNEGADIEVKERANDTKIKMETDDKKVKIKESDDGETKIKIKEDN